MNKDILYEIMYHMTIIDLYYFSLTCHNHYKLCDNNHFWKNKNQLDQTIYNLKQVIKIYHDIINYKNKEFIDIYVPEQYNTKILTYNILTHLKLYDDCFINIIINDDNLTQYIVYNKNTHFTEVNEQIHLNKTIFFKLLLCCIYDMSLCHIADYNYILLCYNNINNLKETAI